MSLSGCALRACRPCRPLGAWPFRGNLNFRSTTPFQLSGPLSASRPHSRKLQTLAAVEPKVLGQSAGDGDDVADRKLESAFKNELKASARLEIENFDANEELAEGDKKYWLVATVPEVPVCGEKCVVYFNRQQSEPLRDRPRVQMQFGFNAWELPPADSNTLDLVPAGLPYYDGGDWWSTTLTVPEEAFEMNFIFSDAESAYDNNGEKDFLLPTSGGPTAEEWDELSIQRAEAAAEARMLAEEQARIAAEKAEKARKLEQDVVDAQNIVNDIIWRREEMQGGGCHEMASGEQRVWYSEPKKLTSGTTAKLFYNSKAGPLKWIDWNEAGAPSLKIGYNFWQEPADLQMTRMTSKETEKDCWWQATIEISKLAVALNFVVNIGDLYDNNNGMDYKVLVELPETTPTVEEWNKVLTQTVRKKVYEDRVAAEEAERKKMEARAAQRSIVLVKSQEVSRKQIRHVLFTDPVQPVAGQSVTLYYNPNNTELAGRSAVYLMGGFNRWSHKQSFGPIEMEAPTAGEHFQATIEIPRDAWAMDFVFSDVESGEGTYDNRGGLDYHLPTTESLAKETPLHVCHISVEMAPIAKVGGLGDVVTSLGRATQDLGHCCEVVLPKYAFFNHSPLLQNLEYDCEFDWGGTKIFVEKGKVEGLQCFFIDPRNGMFDVQSVYGRDDDAVRFDFFCKAALEFLLQTQRQPDIIHTHDWPTAMAAQFFWEDYAGFGLWKPKVVFTIHNMNYGQSRISAAAHHCQKFTTVSPSYAFEIGGHAAIAADNLKLRGIRNGIDPDIWDPETDMFLPMHYNSANVVAGKAAARQELRNRLGLSGWEAENKPMIGVVSRLTAQKGVPLIKHAAWKAKERGGQFVLLGSAPDPKIQSDFEELSNKLRDSDASFYFGFDEPLSHLVYAGCDIILVPSMFEPCGLTQMIAMRYGAVPVVRATGGLRDTVFDVDADKARAAWEMEGSCDWEGDGVDATNGFSFDGTDEGALDYALNRAMDSFYNDREWFHSLQARCMDQDWTWNRPAQEYIELYHQARK